MARRTETDRWPQDVDRRGGLIPAITWHWLIRPICTRRKAAEMPFPPPSQGAPLGGPMQHRGRPRHSPPPALEDIEHGSELAHRRLHAVAIEHNQIGVVADR